MVDPTTLDERVRARQLRFSPAERRVARFFQANREEVLIASASALAEQAGTSDATVIRTAKALGFAGMDELRRSLATELRQNLSPASRIERTLSEVGDDLATAYRTAMQIHLTALHELQRQLTPALFRRAVETIAGATRLHVFGIGPTSAMADYFVWQLGRFGIDALGLTATGQSLADGLGRLRPGELAIVFAYGRVYRELTALFDEAERQGVGTILVTDTLGPSLGARADLVLPAPRGRADLVSTHTATLALIEALLVGIAARRPQATIASLRALHRLRRALAAAPPEPPA